jgi:hypothetical protein
MGKLSRLALAVEILVSNLYDLKANYNKPSVLRGQQGREAR